MKSCTNPFEYKKGNKILIKKSSEKKIDLKAAKHITKRG